MKSSDYGNINLLIPEMRSKVVPRGGIILVIAVVVIFYGGMGWLGYTAYRHKQQTCLRHTRLVQEMQEKATVGRMAADIVTYREVVNRKTGKVKLVEGKTIKWTEFLSAIEGTLPRGTLLTSLELAREGITLKGFTSAHEALAAMVSGMAAQPGLSSPRVLRVEEADRGEVYFEITFDLETKEAENR